MIILSLIASFFSVFIPAIVVICILNFIAWVLRTNRKSNNH